MLIRFLTLLLILQLNVVQAFAYGDMRFAGANIIFHQIENLHNAQADDVGAATRVLRVIKRSSNGLNFDAPNRGVRPPVSNPTSAQIATAEKLGVDPRWVKSNGTLDWPTKANNGFDGGFDGPPTVTKLKPGQTYDRYGGRVDEKGNFTDSGKLSSPTNVPFDQRALPPSSLNSPKKTFEILKPILDVISGNAAPWFGKPGGGTQYQLPMSIDDLVKNGFIKSI